jgi:hypothetical protein
MEWSGAFLLGIGMAWGIFFWEIEWSGAFSFEKWNGLGH